MGVPYPAGVLVRTGAERAALVRRTYALVFVSVLCTIVGSTFGLSQPQLMQAVAAHPFIAMACTFAPLLLAMRARDAFPANIALVLLFTFVEGVFISPILYFYGRSQPGLITQAAVLTIGAFGVLTLYAFVSRRDFSAWGSFFMVGTLGIARHDVPDTSSSGTRRWIYGSPESRCSCSADCSCSTHGESGMCTGPMSMSGRPSTSTSTC
jgi:hypothetical protein